jgi:PAS domain S-box-containing protein
MESSAEYSNIRKAMLPLQALLDERVLDVPDHLLDILPVGVYVCDRAGLIVRYNRAAAELWGCSPKIGDPTVRFCGSYRLYGLNGDLIPHAKCPMGDVLATGLGLRDQEIVIEQPDGARIVAIVNIDAIKDGSGRVVGAVNVFREKPERQFGKPLLNGDGRISEEPLDALPIAVYTTDAAGHITFYNDAAAELWGVRPDLGKSEFCGSWKMYWPDGTPLPHDECPMAMALKEKRPIRGMEAIAERPDGTRVPFIAYPTPLFDASGVLIGAVNTLVDITERYDAEQQQRLLLREMDHRIKNLFALAGGVVTLSARSATTAAELSSAVRDRLMALAKAHALTLQVTSEGRGRIEQSTTLHVLIETMLSPYEGRTDGRGARVTISGPDIRLASGLVTSFALLLHEFATNAAKYGALSTPTGHIDIACSECDGQFALTWQEQGGPRIDSHGGSEGFGTVLARATVKDQLRGEISRDWKPEGLMIRLSVARDRISVE